MEAEEPDIFQYLSVSGDERLKMLSERLIDREKAHWDLSMLVEMLEGNSDPSAAAELERAKELRKNVAYAINKLRAIKKTLGG